MDWDTFSTSQRNRNTDFYERKKRKEKVREGRELKRRLPKKYMNCIILLPNLIKRQNTSRIKLSGGKEKKGGRFIFTQHK